LRGLAIALIFRHLDRFGLRDPVMRLLFRPTTLVLECDSCRTRFDPIEGGVCPTCERLLCNRHLYGSWLRRFRGYFGVRTVCVDCVAGRGPAPLR
jgi:hypothetical protein